MKRAAAGVVLLLATSCRRTGGPAEEALAQAIASRDVAAAQRAIAAGVRYESNVTAGGRRFPTPLLVFLVSEMEAHAKAPDARLQEIAAAAFAHGANPNYRDGSNYLIVDAVRTQDPVLIDAMIQAGLDVKGVGSSRALLEACRSGYTAVAERLVARGVDVNYRWRRYGVTRTPLSEAVQGRHVAIIELLERAGAQEW